MRTLPGNFSFFQYDDGIGIFDRSDAVRNDDHRLQNIEFRRLRLRYRHKSLTDIAENSSELSYRLYQHTDVRNKRYQHSY